jgi:hypothetical protein
MHCITNRMQQIPPTTHWRQIESETILSFSFWFLRINKPANSNGNQGQRAKKLDLLLRNINASSRLFSVKRWGQDSSAWGSISHVVTTVWTLGNARFFLERRLFLRWFPRKQNWKWNQRLLTGFPGRRFMCLLLAVSCIAHRRVIRLSLRVGRSCGMRFIGSIFFLVQENR